MSKKKKIILIIIVILILAISSVIIYKVIKEEPKKAKVVEKLDSIEGYDYHLEDRDTKLYKNEFEQLKENLESSDIDYEEYAKSVAKMFIIDLYTIDNKVNKYDIGGDEFVVESAKESYRLNVKDTLYKYIDDNSYDDRTQDLPIVSEIVVDEIEEDKYELNEEKYDSYLVKLSWDYEEDLDYDDNAMIILIKNKDKLLVVEKTDIKDNDKEVE